MILYFQVSELGKKGWRDLSTSNSFSGGYDNCTGYNASNYGHSTGEGYQTAGEKSSLMSGNGPSQMQNDEDWKWGNNPNAKYVEPTIINIKICLL